MKYPEFEFVLSSQRMGRYLTSCGGETKKAMTLYRLNLRLSQELFTVISCFEVSLRNGIDRHYQNRYGIDWLKNAGTGGGIFDTHNCRITANLINNAVRSTGRHYSHSKVVASLDFGFWRYLFAQPQFHAGGQSLLQIFPAKPRSAQGLQYNQTFVFNQLGLLNDIRNRIAHHEPICFLPGQPVKDTTYARQHHGLILQLFQWMTIDEAALLYGLDHINRVCADIDAL